DPLGANVTELKAQNKNFCIINSNEIGTTNLTQFPEIIISAAQTQTFYNNLFPAGTVHSNLTAYVQNGGILLANLTDNASGPGGGGSWDGRVFIGGLTHTNDFIPAINGNVDDNNIAFPSHPIITGQFGGANGGQIVDVAFRQDLDNFGFSSHGFFTNLPPNTKAILVDEFNQPVMVEYPFGQGIVIASQVTNEWRYVGGFIFPPAPPPPLPLPPPIQLFTPNKKLLANEIGYQESLVGPQQMIRPTVGGGIIQEFKLGTKSHRGIDIDRDVGGDPVKAVASGVVVQAKSLDGKCGDWIWIFHGDIIRNDGTTVESDISTIYLHMATSSISVAVGDNVTQGQTIGLVGKTGMVTGTHLHFGIKQGPIPDDRACSGRIGDTTTPLNPLSTGFLPGFVNYVRSPRFEADPIDLVITDPDGLVVSKQFNQLLDAQYIEVEFLPNTPPSDEGLSDYDTITLNELKIGDYLIQVVPEPDALPSDIFSVFFISDTGTTTVVAEDILVSDIPDQPYIIRATEGQVENIIPLDMEIKQDTIRVSDGDVATALVEIDEGFGATIQDINQATIQLNGASPHRIQMNDDELKIRFLVRDLTNIFPGEDIPLTMTGTLLNGTKIEGKDVVDVRQ
ncbi:MAG: M23 family metallopeptidase, partial [bacterium]